MSPQIRYRTIWIPSAIVFLALLLIFANQPLAVPIPGPLVRYTSSDKNISLMKPSNWKATSRSSQAVISEVTFVPAQNVNYKISADLSGSLMADLAKPIAPTENSFPDGVVPEGMRDQSGAGPPPRPQKSALRTMHELDKRIYTKLYHEYEEGETKQTSIAGLEAMESGFTYKVSSTFSTREISGVRITLLTSDRRVSILYSCPKVMKLVLFPVFDQMTQSLQLGAGGGS